MAQKSSYLIFSTAGEFICFSIPPPFISLFLNGAMFPPPPLFFFLLLIHCARENEWTQNKSDSGFSVSTECLEKRTRSPIGLFRFGGSVCRRHKRSVIFEKKKEKKKAKKLWAEIALCQHRTTSKEKMFFLKNRKNCACDHAKKKKKKRKEKNTSWSSSRFSPLARSLQSPTTDGEIAEDGYEPISIYMRSSVICLGTLFP